MDCGNDDDAVRRARQLKAAIRAEADRVRQAQQDKADLSQRICQRLIGLEPYARARTLLVFIGRHSEVHTLPLLATAWSDGKQVVVPCCVAEQLQLFRIETLEELAPRTLGILEPRAELQQDTGRRIAPPELDLVLVPGVAFDRRGGRLGHGKGYFDKLLCRVPPRTPRIALAFECQLVPDVPMLPHDVFMDRIVTETAVYEGHGPRQTLSD